MICNVPVCDSDIDKPIVIVPTSNTVGKEYVGTSQTDKPTNVQQYSIYHELDTGKNYYYDNGQWNEIPCCSGGGGGGGGDYNTAFVTVAEPEGEYHYSFSVELYANDFSAYPGIFVTDNGFESMASKGMLESQTTFKLIYLGDSCVVYPYNTVTGVSGDAVYDSDTGAVTITGDCTITGYTDD